MTKVFALTVIARHELRAGWRDGRLRCAAAIVLVLLMAAVVSGWSYQQRLEQERETASTAEQARWLGQGDKNPHSAAHYGTYAFKPVSPLSAIDQGIQPFIGVGVWLEAHNMNQFVHRPAQDGTALTRFGELTAALTLQVLLPLLLILLAFGAFAAERERGTLRQLLSLGLSARTLASGKMLGAAGIMAVLILPAVLLGSLAIMLYRSPDTADGEARFWLLVGAYLVYLTGWLFVSLAVSACAKTSRAALVTLFGFWVLGCLALPRVAADAAAAMYPAPSAAAFRQALEQDKNPSHSSERALQRRERIMKEYGVSRPEDLPIDWRGISLQEEEELNYPIFDRHYAALFDSYRSQDRVLQTSGLLAPLLAVQSLSHALSGTDFEHHRHFAFAAEARRRLMQKVLNADVTLHDREGTDYKAGPDLWATIPAFDYEPLKLRDLWPHYTVALGALVVWLGGSAAAAFLAIRRIKP
jgi:ABC-2 type transport system permease protein